ncbi:MAG: hypothetical protein II919_00040 [Lachnospiraceae bacterium]|nr:hypothetical protein [Lachnospiraceae bacterium]
MRKVLLIILILANMAMLTVIIINPSGGKTASIQEKTDDDGNQMKNTDKKDRDKTEKNDSEQEEKDDSEKKDSKKKTEESETETEKEEITEKKTKKTKETSEEATTKKPEKATTKKESDPSKETEKQTEEQTKTEQKLPYEDSIGRPAATDFAWLIEASNGELPPDYKSLGKEDFVGKWKAEYIFDGVWELVYVTIDESGNITVEPYQVNYGEGWIDEIGESPYHFNGSFDVGGVYGSSEYGNMTLYSFYESYGVQYGLGFFTVQSGETATVGLIRP